MPTTLARAGTALVLLLAFGAGSAAAAQPSAQAARERQMKAVVHAWSNRLNAGDNEGLARLYRVPALIAQGPYAYRLVSRKQVALWYSGLPCSGEVVSILIHGRFATVVFRLGDRGKMACDAPGTLAAALFEIVRGKIVSWEQIPVPAVKKPPAAKAPPGPVA
jgi:hypothetical protein